MKKLGSITMYTSKVLEILCWIGAALLIIATVAGVIGINWLNKQIDAGEIELTEFKISGKVKLFDVKLTMVDNKLTFDEDSSNELFGHTITESDLEKVEQAVDFVAGNGLTEARGMLRLTSIIPAMIVLAITSGVFAMVFRKIYLILKTAKGKTKFSEGETPFQTAITRMVREIGILLLGLFVVRLVASFFTSFVSANFSYLLFGALMLCLSSIFGYGERLQKDSDELI